jgi:hypothetical protein
MSRNVGIFETEINATGAFAGTPIGEADRRRADLVPCCSSFLLLISPTENIISMPQATS